MRLEATRGGRETLIVSCGTDSSNPASSSAESSANLTLSRSIATVSFVLGSDPDINANAVNNRVQTALSQLPQEVQLEGLTVQKKSSAILQYIVLYRETGDQD